MRFNEKQKVTVVAAVFGVLLVGIGVLNYFKFRERGKWLAEIEKYNREEIGARDKIRQIPTLLEERAKLVDSIDTYTRILPLDSEVEKNNFVNIIDGYRKDTGIVIRRAQYVEVKDEDAAKSNQNFVRHRYRFALTGTVPDFLSFMNKIENHPRFLKLDAIKIKPSGAAGAFDEELRGDGDEGDLGQAAIPVKDIEITVSTYTYARGNNGSAQS